MPHAWQESETVNAYLSGMRAALPLAAEQLQVMLFVIGQARPSVTRFLDLGCGDGTLSRVLRDRYPSADPTLVDFSAPMLDAARGHFPAERVHHADLSDPAWVGVTTPPYDVIVSGYAIHHLTDARKKALYREVFDLLAPGGVFVNVDHVASPTPWVEAVFEEAFADGLARTDERPRAQILADFRVDDGDICAPVEDQCAWLREIGYAHVDTYMKIYALAVFGGLRPAISP